MSITLKFLKLLSIFFLIIKWQQIAAQIQFNYGNNNINIQSNGSYNTIIGKISYTTVKNINITKATVTYALFKIIVNTRCKVYEDRHQIGISTVDLPLKLKLSKGVHRLRIQAEHYIEYDLPIEVKVDKELIGLENYLDFKFDVLGDLYPIAEKPNGRYGYINLRTKEVAIPFQFSEAKRFRYQLAAACKNNKCGYIDQFGEVKIDFKFSSVGSFFMENRAKASNTAYRQFSYVGEEGIIDTTGNFIIDPIKYSIQTIDERYATFQDDNGDYGIIDFNGRELLKLEKTSGINLVSGTPLDIEYSNGMYLVRNAILHNNKYGLFDYYWKQLLPVKYNQIIYKGLPKLYRKHGAYIVNNGGTYELLDSKGTFVSKVYFPYDWIEDLTGSLFQVKKGEKIGVVDLDFNQVLPPVYDLVGAWRGLLGVDSGGRIGFFNLNGKKILPFDYTDNDDGFYFDLIILKKGEKLGFINELGKEVSPFIYDEIRATKMINFDNIFYGYNYGIVGIGDRFGLIDKKGLPLTPVIFDETEGFLFSNQYAVVQKGKQYGLVSQTGTITYFSQPFIKVEALPFNIYQATLSGKYIYFNQKLECIYGCASR